MAEQPELEQGFSEIEALMDAADEQMVDLDMGTAASILLSLRGKGWRLIPTPASPDPEGEQDG